MYLNFFTPFAPPCLPALSISHPRMNELFLFGIPSICLVNLLLTPFFVLQCLADIKVTPNGRFYPGTHERVVLVVGEPGSVQLACDRIVTTIYTAADTSLDITQRVLIPDAASGLIIGHDGVRLGDLRQEAGVASIQVAILSRSSGYIHESSHELPFL